jgi:hypothetical protein
VAFSQGKLETLHEWSLSDIQQGRGKNRMSRRRHRKKFGEAFNDSKDDSVEGVHESYTWGGFAGDLQFPD